MKTAIDRIVELGSETTASITEQQLSIIPHINTNWFSTIDTEYFYEGHRILIDGDRLCLRMHHIPFNKTKESDYLGLKDVFINFLTLFNQGRISPFMVFLNGYFIKWSDIDVVYQTGKSYLIINDVDAQHPGFKDLAILGELEVTIVDLPGNAKYSESYEYGDEENLIFAFKEDGSLDVEGPPNIAIYNKSIDLYHHEWTTVGTVNAFYSEVNRDYYLDPSNIIVFKEGLLSTSTDISTIGPFITLDGGTTQANYTFTVFYNSRVHAGHNNVSKLNLVELQQYIQDKNNGLEVPLYMEDLLTNFNFEYNRDISFDDNIAASAKYIMEYNSDLFEDIYCTNSNLEISQVTGQWVKNHTDVAGYLNIPRRRTNENDGYVIMLVNGELYNYYYTHYYRANRFIISIFGIEDDDVVEFLFFRDVCNRVLDITVNEDDPYSKYSEYYRNMSMNIFFNETDTAEFEYPEDGLQNFDIKHSFMTNSNGESKIVFDNPFYYGKPAKLAYRNQFRYFRYIFTYNNAIKNEISVDIGDEFKFCPEYSKYMVFLNGRYMSTDRYRLVLPVKDTTPFNRFYIYLTIPVSENDVLEVFYLPILVNDIVTHEQIESGGDIVVDTSKVSYNLSKNTYMVWVNGRKIPADQISNISRNKLKIINDIKSIHTVCVTKYIEDNDYLTDVFKSNMSIWDSIINSLTITEVCKLLGIDPVSITDTDPSIFSNSYTITSVMWEIIRDQYMSNSVVDVTGPFVYDYLDVGEVTDTITRRIRTAPLKSHQNTKLTLLDSIVSLDPIKYESSVQLEQLVFNGGNFINTNGWEPTHSTNKINGAYLVNTGSGESEDCFTTYTISPNENNHNIDIMNKRFYITASVYTNSLDCYEIYLKASDGINIYDIDYEASPGMGNHTLHGIIDITDADTVENLEIIIGHKYADESTAILKSVYINKIMCVCTGPYQSSYYYDYTKENMYSLLGGTYYAGGAYYINPSVYTPLPISYTTNQFNLMVSGKNIFTTESLQNQYDKFNLIGSDLQIQYLDGNTSYIDLINTYNGRYTDRLSISYDARDNSSSSLAFARVGVVYYDKYALGKSILESVEWTESLNSVSMHKVQFTTAINRDVYAIIIGNVSGTKAGGSTIRNLQIEKNIEPTTYEAFRGSNYSIDIKPVDYTGNDVDYMLGSNTDGSVSDLLSIVDDDYVVRKFIQFKKYENVSVDDFDMVAVDDHLNAFIDNASLNTMTGTEITSTHFKNIDPSDNLIGTYIENNKIVFVAPFDSVDDFVSYLNDQDSSNNPIIVKYCSDTERYVSISDDAQVSLKGIAMGYYVSNNVTAFNDMTSGLNILDSNITTEPITTPQVTDPEGNIILDAFNSNREDSIIDRIFP